MGPGPPNLGDNRFAPLAISPPSKKRRQPQKLDMAFPELPPTAVDNPRYITIASINTDHFAILMLRRPPRP